MKLDLPRLAATVAPALVLAAWGVGATAFVASTMESATREAFAQAIEPLAAPLVFGWLLLSLGGGMAVHKAWGRWVAPPARLAELTALVVRGDGAREIPPLEGDALKGLRESINALARERGDLRADMDRRVREALDAGSREIEHERSRLAALMSELTQSVVVCNLDGRVLLYNNRARFQFRALSDARPSRAAPSSSASAARSMPCSTASSWRMRWRASASVWHAGRTIRRRSSSPPRAAGSCFVRRWPRCDRAARPTPSSAASC